MTTPTPYPELTIRAQRTHDGFELPIEVDEHAPVQTLDEESLRQELLLTRERLTQFEVTLEKLVLEFDRNLGAVCTLPSLPQAKVLLKLR